MSNERSMRTADHLDSEINSLWEFAVVDGISNLEKFEKARVKILWILKEPHKKTPQDTWNNRCLLSDLNELPNWKTTYSKVLQTSFGLLEEQFEFDHVPLATNEGEFGDGVFPGDEIALININKGGGGATADHTALRKEYERTRDFLHRQIDYIDPDIIINAHHVVELLNDLVQTEKFVDVGGCKYCRVGKRLIIDAQHPNVRGSNKEYFNAVMRAYCSPA